MLGKPLGSWSAVVSSTHPHPTVHPPSSARSSNRASWECGTKQSDEKMNQLKHTDFSTPWQRKWVFRFACVGKERGIPGAKKLFVCHGLWKVVVCTDPGWQNKCYQIACEILNIGTQMNQISWIKWEVQGQRPYKCLVVRLCSCAPVTAVVVMDSVFVQGLWGQPHCCFQANIAFRFLDQVQRS